MQMEKRLPYAELLPLLLASAASCILTFPGCETAKLTDTRQDELSAGSQSTKEGGSTEVHRPDWPLVWGGEDFELASRVTTDEDGSIYVAGIYQGTCDFDPGPDECLRTSPGGGNNVFLLKLDSTGVFQWVRQPEGYGFKTPSAVSVDGDGNVYLLGAF